jgi:hypothetical protein
MKYIVLALLFVSPLVIAGEIYKCKKPDGKLGFSDKPCPDDVMEERITLKQQKADWLRRLRTEKPSYIDITEIFQKDADVSIKYEFKTNSDSNSFIRLANQLSKMPVVLIKYTNPKGGQRGRAEIMASTKPNPLFEKIKSANKLQNP